MRILMLNYEYPPLGGGAGNATYHLLKEFSKDQNIHVDLVTSSTGVYREEQFSENIKIYFLDIGKTGNLCYQSNEDLITYSIKSYMFCKELIKNHRYDLCHAFFGIPSGYTAMKLGMRYIVSLRGSDVPFYNKRFELLDKLIFKRLSKTVWGRAEKVIANSGGLEALATETNPEQEIDVIPNGVDTNEFSPNNEPKMNMTIKLVSTGRLIKRKGYEYLIKALEGAEGVELNLIGDGNLKGELEMLAKKYEININFLGRKDHDEIKRYLCQSDIFIMSSLNEGMSNSILEAMACGLSIITTDVGGAEELIDGNGIVVKKASSEALRGAIEEYKASPNLIKEHGARSRKIALGMGWDQVAKAYMDVYYSV